MWNLLWKKSKTQDGLAHGSDEQQHQNFVFPTVAGLRSGPQPQWIVAGQSLDAANAYRPWAEWEVRTGQGVGAGSCPLGVIPIPGEKQVAGLSGKTSVEQRTGRDVTRLHTCQLPLHHSRGATDLTTFIARDPSRRPTAPADGKRPVSPQRQPGSNSCPVQQPEIHRIENISERPRRSEQLPADLCDGERPPAKLAGGGGTLEAVFESPTRASIENTLDESRHPYTVFLEQQEKAAAQQRVRRDRPRVLTQLMIPEDSGAVFGASPTSSMTIGPHAIDSVPHVGDLQQASHLISMAQLAALQQRSQTPGPSRPPFAQPVPHKPPEFSRRLQPQMTATIQGTSPRMALPSPPFEPSFPPGHKASHPFFVIGPDDSVASSQQAAPVIPSMARLPRVLGGPIGAGRTERSPSPIFTTPSRHSEARARARYIQSRIAEPGRVRPQGAGLRPSQLPCFLTQASHPISLIPLVNTSFGTSSSVRASPDFDRWNAQCSADLGNLNRENYGAPFQMIPEHVSNHGTNRNLDPQVPSLRNNGGVPATGMHSPRTVPVGPLLPTILPTRQAIVAREGTSDRYGRLALPIMSVRAAAAAAAALVLGRAPDKQSSIPRNPTSPVVEQLQANAQEKRRQPKARQPPLLAPSTHEGQSPTDYPTEQLPTESSQPVWPKVRPPCDPSSGSASPWQMSKDPRPSHCEAKNRNVWQRRVPRSNGLNVRKKIVAGQTDLTAAEAGRKLDSQASDGIVRPVDAAPFSLPVEISTASPPSAAGTVACPEPSAKHRLRRKKAQNQASETRRVIGPNLLNKLRETVSEKWLSFDGPLNSGGRNATHPEKDLPASGSSSAFRTVDRHSAGLGPDPLFQRRAQSSLGTDPAAMSSTERSYLPPIVAEEGLSPGLRTASGRPAREVFQPVEDDERSSPAKPPVAERIPSMKRIGVSKRRYVQAAPLQGMDAKARAVAMPTQPAVQRAKPKPATQSMATHLWMGAEPPEKLSLTALPDRQSASKDDQVPTGPSAPPQMSRLTRREGRDGPGADCGKKQVAGRKREKDAIASNDKDIGPVIGTDSPRPVRSEVVRHRAQQSSSRTDMPEKPKKVVRRKGLQVCEVSEVQHAAKVAETHSSLSEGACSEQLTTRTAEEKELLHIEEARIAQLSEGIGTNATRIARARGDEISGGGSRLKAASEGLALLAGGIEGRPEVQARKVAAAYRTQTGVVHAAAVAIPHVGEQGTELTIQDDEQCIDPNAPKASLHGPAHRMPEPPPPVSQQPDEVMEVGPDIATSAERDNPINPCPPTAPAHQSALNVGFLQITEPLSEAKESVIGSPPEPPPLETLTSPSESVADSKGPSRAEKPEIPNTESNEIPAETSLLQTVQRMMESFPLLLQRDVPAYPRQSFIVKRDKELRKVRNFGWQYASKELQALLPTLSRYTIEHRSDTQQSRLTGLDGAPLMCQSQLLAQIAYGLQPRDVFGYYFRLGPPGDSTEEKLNRYTDKRRIQNATRRVLENLLSNEQLLALVVDAHPVPAALLWKTVEELRKVILLPSSVTERSVVLASIFTHLWNSLQNTNSGRQGSSDSLTTIENGEPCFTLQGFNIALTELNLWPSETNIEDRNEVCLALTSAHPDLLPMLQSKQGIPNLLSISLLVGALLPLPYNLPDFPAPERTDRQLPTSRLTDQELLSTAIEVCHILLNVHRTAWLVEERQRVAGSVIETTLKLKHEEADYGRQLAGLIETRSALLAAGGYGSVGLPPKFFFQQDVLMSQIMSVEELQALMILSRTAQRKLFPYENRIPDDEISWDVRLLMRCLHLISGVVHQCLTEAEWAFVAQPFNPNAALPNVRNALSRCRSLKRTLSEQTSNATGATTKSTGIGEGARVILQAPHTHRVSQPASSVVSTDSGVSSLPASSPGSFETTVQISTEQQASRQQVQKKGADERLRSPTTERTAQAAAGRPGVTDPSKSESNPNELQTQPLVIDWTSFLYAEPTTLSTEVCSIQQGPPGSNPLLHMPGALTGMYALWKLKAADTDQSVLAGISAAPSGFLPAHVTSLQVCCRLFEFIVLQSGCFDECKPSDCCCETPRGNPHFRGGREPANSVAEASVVQNAAPEPQSADPFNCNKAPEEAVDVHCDPLQNQSDPYAAASTAGSPSDCEPIVHADLEQAPGTTNGSANDASHTPKAGGAADVWPSRSPWPHTVYVAWR